MLENLKTNTNHEPYNCPQFSEELLQNRTETKHSKLKYKAQRNATQPPTSSSRRNKASFLIITTTATAQARAPNVYLFLVAHSFHIQICPQNNEMFSEWEIVNVFTTINMIISSNPMSTPRHSLRPEFFRSEKLFGYSIRYKP